LQQEILRPKINLISFSSQALWALIKPVIVSSTNTNVSMALSKHIEMMLSGPSSDTAPSRVSIDFPILKDDLNIGITNTVYLGNKYLSRFNKLWLSRVKYFMQGYKYYFENDVLINPTPEFAYYLGWMWGDGCCFHKGNVFQSRLELQEQDSLEIVDFFESFCLPAKLIRQRNGRKKTISINLYDKVLGLFLEQNDYEIKSSCSPEKILLFLPDNLHQFWFRGFFEADGHASFREQSIKGYMLSKIEFYASYNQNWDFLYKFLSKGNINPKIIKRTRNCGSSSIASFCKQSEVNSFINLVYSDLPEIQLKRKVKILMNMKKYINRNFSC
jgi:hypothetical protein